jgi:hypothetical protein
MRRLSHPARSSASSVRTTRAAAGDSDFLPRDTPFCWSFFLLAIFHSVIYSLLVCESPAQAFLVREQANFTGLASICVQSQQQLATFQTILSVALLYTTLAYSQRTQEAEAQQAAKDIVLHSTTQPPSLASLAGSVSGTHFLGVFAFLPTIGGSGGGASEGAAAGKAAAGAARTAFDAITTISVI